MNETQSSQSRNARISFILITTLLVAFFAAWPLISEPGFLNTRGGGDSPFLLQRLQQLESALRDSHFPARWMGDANYGFGYPFYNYYAPLSIYVAVFFRLLGFSMVRSIEVAQVFGFLLAALGIYLLSRRWYRNEWAALLASVAYTTAPFHLVNVYVRGDSLAEFWAMALYPWVILAADRLLAEETRGVPYGRVAALALTYGALILSHNISALIFTPFLILFILLRWLLGPYRAADGTISPFSRVRLPLLLPLLAAGLLGLALAAWFFVPALVEQQYARLGPVTEGYFSYANHFRGLNLVQTRAVFDYDVSGGNAFRMGLVQAVAALLGSLAIIYYTFRAHLFDRAPALFILFSLAVATFMITPLSAFLWENLPLLSFTQFPWRFLSIQAFAAALAIGALALLPYCRVLAVGTAVLLVISSFAALHTDHILIGDDDVTAGSLAQYEWFTGNIGSTVSAEYLPQTVQPRFFNSAWLNDGRRANARPIEGELLTIDLLEQQTDRQRWSLRVGEEGALVLFPTMAWPGWTAELGDQPLGIQPAPGSGLITVELPAGEHELILTLAGRPLRRGAELISFGALIFILYLLYRAWSTPRIGRTTVVTVAGLVAFLLLFRFWPSQTLSAGTMTWDFAQMAYLHHDEDGVPFNSGTTLLSYEYEDDSIAAGEHLHITLTFSEANQDVLTVALGSPVLSWPAITPEPPVVTEQSRLLDNEQMVYDLHIPENAPAGLVIPRVTMDVGRPLMPSGGPRGDLYLRPLRITNERQATSGEAPLDVGVMDVTVRDDASALDVQLVWTAREPLTHNYNASLLLIDQAGNWLAQLDTQPGYGFRPSSEWLPGAAVDDWLALGLPDELPESGTLALVARLYEVDSGTIVLVRRLGEIALQDGEIVFEENQPLFALPDDLTPMSAVFEDQIQLQGYDLQQEADGVWRLTLYWQALEANSEEAVRFVHVFDPATEEIVYQSDGHPRSNTYPTSQWREGEIVADTLTVQLDDSQTGEYQIGVGFYRQDGENVQRFTAVDPDTGDPYPDARVLLTQTIK